VLGLSSFADALLGGSARGTTSAEGEAVATHSYITTQTIQDDTDHTLVYGEITDVVPLHLVPRYARAMATELDKLAAAGPLLNPGLLRRRAAWLRLRAAKGGPRPLNYTPLRHKMLVEIKRNKVTLPPGQRWSFHGVFASTQQQMARTCNALWQADVLDVFSDEDGEYMAGKVELNNRGSDLESRWSAQHGDPQ
jgi:hypothetical protein